MAYKESDLSPLQAGNRYEERMDCMSKEKFLTVRWNNLLSLGLGLPALIYVVFALSSSLWLGQGGMIGLAVIGALY